MFRINRWALCALFIIFTCISTSNGELKKWRHTTNFSDRRNWIEGTLPCASDTVVLPNSLDAALALPSKQLSLHALELPRDGELLLPDNSVLLFSKDRQSKTCNGKNKHFHSVNMRGWLDPDSWTATNGWEHDVVPHLEQIPCTYDRVSIPTADGVLVQMPEVAVSVAGIDLDGNVMTQHSFEEFLFSELGSRELHHDDSQVRDQIITIDEKQCMDAAGCVCHYTSPDVYAELATAVCNYAAPECSIAHCLHPIRPIGFCCDLCGAYLLFKYTKDYTLKHLEEFLRETLHDHPALSYHASKVPHENQHIIQIILTATKDYDETSADFAPVLLTHIQNDHSLGLMFYSLQKAGQPFYASDGIGPFQFMLGTFIIVIMTMSVIFIIFYPINGRRRRFYIPTIQLPTFTMPTFGQGVFARFENPLDGNGTLDFGSRSVASSLFNLDNAFDNPLYGEPVACCSTDLQVSPQVELEEESNELIAENTEIEGGKEVAESEESI